MSQTYAQINSEDSLSTVKPVLNNDLDALLTLHSGAAASRPTYAAPGMIWHDETNALWKGVTAANTGITDVSFLTDGGGNEEKLVTTTGINGKTTATPTILTSAFPFVVTKLVVRITAITSIAAAPTIGLKITTAGDVIQNTLLAGIDGGAVGDTWHLPVIGKSIGIPNATAVKLDVTGATGTTLTLAVDLFGYKL